MKKGTKILIGGLVLVGVISAVGGNGEDKKTKEEKENKVAQEEVVKEPEVEKSKYEGFTKEEENRMMEVAKANFIHPEGSKEQETKMFKNGDLKTIKTVYKYTDAYGEYRIYDYCIVVDGDYNIVNCGIDDSAWGIEETVKHDLIKSCKELITNSLKCPSTAKFPGEILHADEWKIGKNDSGQIIIQSYVDAENGFGAKIRSNFQIRWDKESNQIILEYFE